MATTEGIRVMLSYNHKSKAIVKAVYKALVDEKVPVWFDEKDMEDNILDSMAEGVFDATIVCCFMSPGYEASDNCKLELQHAQRHKKRIIPCMAVNRKVWKPSPRK
ncbi:unnamed protein product, partial [Rotaria sp. Silwood1]